MIVAIVSADLLSATTCTAASLAERRALAGRNVLLLQQNMNRKQGNQYQKISRDIAWSHQEIKTGTRPVFISSNSMIEKLMHEHANFHDIVIDIPGPFYADAKTALSLCNLLVYHTELHTRDKEKQAKLHKCIRQARTINKNLPVLITINKIASAQGQKFVSELSQQLRNIEFICLDQSHDMSLTHLYRAIYLP